MGLLQIEIKPQHTQQQALAFYRKSKNRIEKKHAHLIWLLISGMDLLEAEETIDYSHVQAIKIIKNYNQNGFNNLNDQRKFNKGRPPLLSDPQILLLAQIIRHDFLNNIIWDAKKVHQWMEQTLNRKIHFTKVYKYISMMNLSFQEPRPRHEENIESLLEDFKKKTYQK
jgi:transposase